MKKNTKAKVRRADYKGFCLEYDERCRRGFPIDCTTLVEMAAKYRTPVPPEVAHVHSKAASCHRSIITQDNV